MLNEKTSTQTNEKYAMEIRQEKRLKQAYTEIDKISAERDESYEFIRTILLEFEDSADKWIKKKIIHFKRIFKNSNV